MFRRLAAALVLAVTGVAVFFGVSRADEPVPRDKPAPQAAAVTVAVPSGADVHYAQMMADHHGQAVRMSRALLAKPGVPERIAAIADFIAHDQQREIDESNAWLAAWNAPPARAGGAMPGMLTEAQLMSLDRAKTGAAPGLFLRLMIEHHEGAIVMSRELLAGGGTNVYVHGLAKHVINEQSAEIDAMRALL
ncbi:DUF305 domain-containing protein [Symbioplanes lichenis]|uniref:DUF305 domain-containing protein n=1 Tax=Symbioplanes lichenis TaxID=1629072 RepID=UPI00273A123B|nr:DUF305 domain-containing protein [Actinoplanes lichenis]